MAKGVKTHKERSEQTIQSVLEIAEAQFASLGYNGVATESVVEAAGLTRGALYHHFGSKQGLFEAVVERVQTRLAGAVARESGQQEDPWQAFVAGCFTWLEHVTKPEVQTILLIDAPAVLGWERWQAIDSEHGSRLLKEAISELVGTGEIAPPAEEALFHLLNGAMNQAALWVAQSPQPEEALEEAKQTLRVLLGGLRQ